MNWKITLTKGIVVGGLASLGVWAADLQGVQVGGNVPPWWVGIAVLVLEALRDGIKTRFAPKP